MIDIIHLSDKRPRSSTEEVVIIDDSSSNEKSGKKAEGAGVQYSGREKRLMNCNVVVISHYADRIKDFHVRLSPHIPEDKIKEGEKFLSKVDRPNPGKLRLRQRHGLRKDPF